MRSAPLGQDVLFDEKNVELGRNFCTKLWNAARFRQMQSGQTEAEIRSDLLALEDKWILLRLDRAIHEVSTALNEYRFSDAAQSLYRFFWSEYCDWYVEASKATLSANDPDRRANTLAVMDFVLSHALRLFHPFLPFITEELWHGLGYHEDLPENQGGASIMQSLWPSPLGEDFLAHYGLLAEDETGAQARFDVVLAGRGLRRDFNLPSNKKVAFVLRNAIPLTPHDVEVLRILLNAEAVTLEDGNWTPSKGTPSALTPLGTLFLPLAGLVDVEAERQRLGKEVDKIGIELTKVRAKLGQETFVSGAPAAVVEEHRKREADWSEKLAQIQRILESLGS
jgi:valyl-tRNA synthetase